MEVPCGKGVPMSDYTTRTVDGARAHAAQFAEPEPLIEVLDDPPEEDLEALLRWIDSDS